MTSNSKKPVLRSAPLSIKLIGFLFHQLYHTFAWSYDWVAAAVSVGQWNQWVLSAFPYLSGPRILELGFGPGHLQVALHESAMLQAALQEGSTNDGEQKVFGLDESPQMVRQAYHRLANHNGYAHLINLCRGTAQYLPFPSGSFDNVVATFPSPYIIHPLSLAQIYRVLSPGGTLLIVLSAEFTSHKPLHRAAALLFKATGQASPDSSPFTQRIDAVGFATRTFFVDQPSSRVLLIEATKGS